MMQLACVPRTPPSCAPHTPAHTHTQHDIDSSWHNQGGNHLFLHWPTSTLSMFDYSVVKLEECLISTHVETEIVATREKQLHAKSKLRSSYFIAVVFRFACVFLVLNSRRFEFPSESIGPQPRPHNTRLHGDFLKLAYLFSRSCLGRFFHKFYIVTLCKHPSFQSQRYSLKWFWGSTMKNGLPAVI